MTSLTTHYRAHVAAAVVLLLLASTYITFAQGAPDPGNGKGLVPCSGPDCNWCSLIQLIQNLINYAIYLGVLLSAIIFAYAGVEYMTQDSEWNMLRSGGSGGKEYAKKILSGVVIGLLCILGGWLVIDTLLKALVDDAKFGVWNKIDCQIQTNTTEAGSNYNLPTNARQNTNRRPTDDLFQ